jgi:integrase
MSVRKRTWHNRDGSEGEAWVVNYTDQGGTRRLKSFDRKKDADAFAGAVSVDIRAGIHIPDRDSITVAEAAQLWLASADAAGLERSTREQYRRHVKLHIVPLLGAVKLTQLTVPAARAFEDRLRRDRSTVMVRKILTSLGSMLSDAQERGLVAQKLLISAIIRGARRRPVNKPSDARARGRLKIGIDIPSPDEIRTIITALNDHPQWRPLLLTAMFTGLRSSELRGLRWSDIDLKAGELHVRQRADRYRKMGPPKSESGERTIPLPPMLSKILREWKLACPKGDLDLVFPNVRGRVMDYNNITARGLGPIEIAAGVVTKSGKAKYGLHALRHFYASWCINRQVDGGLELPLKVVQARLGHASIRMTADRYGHLFPRGDDGAEMAAAEKAFLS